METRNTKSRYISLPRSLTGDGRNNLFILVASSAKQFRSYGIRVGSNIVFDGDLPFVEGYPSSFSHEVKGITKYKMSKKQVPGYVYAGRMIACLTNWADQDAHECSAPVNAETEKS